MATIYLSLSAKKNLLNKQEILIRFSHGKINQRAKTGMFVPSEYWNENEQKIIVPNFRLMNNEQKELKNNLNSLSKDLSELVVYVQTIFMETNVDIIGSNWLKSEIEKYYKPETHIPESNIQNSTTLLQYIEDFISLAHTRKDKNTGRLLSYNNIQQYKATEKHLKEFAKAIKRKDFSFDEINQSFYNKFISYLQSEIPELDKNKNQKIDNYGNPVFLKKKFTQNTVGKHIRILKLMLNDGNIKEVDISNFHVFTEEVDNIYLDESELKNLKEIDLKNNPHLDRVRDWFLLLSWTGCRFSDLEKISKTDIKDGFITFRQQKTNTKVTIPLHPVVLEILEKYEYNMPEVISNQKFNVYIKEVGKLAGINDNEVITKTIGGKLTSESMPKYELISSHTGRRSFCTNMYKRGLPTLMIMSISGHKTEKSFLKYIKVRQEEHAAMMKREWERMYQ